MLMILIFRWHAKRIHIFVSVVLLSSFSRELVAIAQHGQFKLNVIRPHLYAGRGYTEWSMPCFSMYSFEKEKSSRFSLFFSCDGYLPQWKSLRSLEIILTVSDPSAHLTVNSELQMWSISTCCFWERSPILEVKQTETLLVVAQYSQISFFSY